MRTHTNAHPEKEKDGETRRDWEGHMRDKSSIRLFSSLARALNRDGENSS